MKIISKIPAVEVSHLTVSYGGDSVLLDCSVVIPQGVMLGIIGPNGAGKTTFIKSVLGLVPQQSGTVLILGASVSGARKKIAYVPQRSTVDWDFPLTVFDMVLMGCYGKLGWFKRPGAIERAQTQEALVAVGLEKYADQSIGTLSGGQQQRAFLARALVQDAQVYFLDEPFAGVDIPTEKIIIELFKTLRNQGKTVIVVHHDLPTAPIYFDWVMLLNKKSIACGPVDEVLLPNYLDCAYGNGAALRAWDFKKYGHNMPHCSVPGSPLQNSGDESL